MKTYTVKIFEDGVLRLEEPFDAVDEEAAIREARIEAMAYQEDSPLTDGAFTVRLETADGRIIVDRQIGYCQEVGELCS